MVMLYSVDPRRVVRLYVLMAVRDGFDRIQLARSADWYDATAWRLGCEEPLIAPPDREVQRLSAALAAYGRLDKRIWSWITRWLRRWAGGKESGRFRFRLEHEFVPVAYSIRWAMGRVAELEIAVTPSHALAQAAQRQLAGMFPEDP